jgi:hypothetical protein
MIGHQVAAAFAAILPLAERRFLKCGDMFRASRDLYGIRFPKRECVDWAAGPGSARPAVAIAHGFRRARSFNLDLAAKALALIRHRIHSSI